ncbi:MAG: hypothetical protein DLM69_10955 [Candidatus Chloroheliales bacterium]|nr:MAG: hypothetical protein DLM69_10955 [Chloroflexota bacterium]
MGIGRKLLIGAGLTAASIAYNALDKLPHEPDNDFAPASAFVTIDGYRTHFIRRLPSQPMAGQPTIVLVHGFGGWTFVWRKDIDVLGAHYPTYAYDRWGFGLSAKPRDLEYTTELYVEQLRGLLDRFGIERAVLVGHSSGGPIAIRAAVELGSRVVGLVLAASSGLEPMPPAVLIRLFARTPFATTLLRVLIKLNVFGEGMRIAYFDPAKFNQAVADGYDMPARTAGIENGLLGRLRSGNPNAGTKEMATQVRTPTLVIVADHDRIVPPWRGRRFADLIPHAKLAMIHEANHMLVEECPDEFNHLVLDFVGGLLETII